MEPQQHIQRASAFTNLHVAGDPLILVNAWDVVSARAVAAAAPAVATSSGAVSAARGHLDGESLPLQEVLDLTARMADAIDKPLSVDFEAGYSDDPDQVGENAARLARAGAVGLNLEDGYVGHARRLADPHQHARKIAAIRAATLQATRPLFINARIDTWWLSPAGDVDELLAETERRAAIYAEAGADGVFVPLLNDLAAIERLAERLPLPLNIMAHPRAPEIAELAAAGVARVSLATWPMLALMEVLGAMARTTLAEKRYAPPLRPA